MDLGTKIYNVGRGTENEEDTLEVMLCAYSRSNASLKLTVSEIGNGGSRMDVQDLKEK